MVETGVGGVIEKVQRPVHRYTFYSLVLVTDDKEEISCIGELTLPNIILLSKQSIL